MKHTLVLPLAIIVVGAAFLIGQPAPFAPLPPVPKAVESFRDVVKKVLPAVVTVDAKSDKTARTKDAEPDNNLGFGTGVLIDPAGVVLTNFHVVEGAASVEVTLQDGRKFASESIRTDSKTDLAVIRLKKVEVALPFLDLGDSDRMEVGDRVLAVGAPFGLSGSVTHGIISAKSRNNLKLNQYEDFLQTDAAINPGNSGGPLVNMDGQVIGITSAIKTKTGGFQGVGLAISSNMAKDVSAQLLKNGVVRRGYLGVGLRALDDELADRQGVKRGGGVVVSKVYDNSPAAKAGLLPGDIITSIGGTAVKDAFELPRVVAKLPLNEKAEITFVRNGKPFTQLVMIEEQPEDYTVKPARPLVPQGTVFAEIGLSVIELTPILAGQMGYPKETVGLVVAGVERGSLAAAAGLVRSHVIVKVDKTPVPTIKALEQALAAVNNEKGALLSLLRPSGEIDYAILKVK